MPNKGFMKASFNMGPITGMRTYAFAKKKKRPCLCYGKHPIACCQEGYGRLIPVVVVTESSKRFLIT